MFVGRNEDGSIHTVWSIRQWEGQEELADDHADVVAFLNRTLPTPTPEQKLAAAGLTVAELKQLLGLPPD